MGDHKFHRSIPTQRNQQPHLNITFWGIGHLCLGWDENCAIFKRKIKDKRSHHAVVGNHSPSFVCQPDSHGYTQGWTLKLFRCTNVHHTWAVGRAEEALSAENRNLHEQKNEPDWPHIESRAFSFRWHHHKPRHRPNLRRRCENLTNIIIPSPKLLPQAFLPKQRNIQNDLEDALRKIRKLRMPITLVIPLQANLRHPSLLLLQVTQKMILYFFSPMMFVGLYFYSLSYDGHGGLQP